MYISGCYAKKKQRCWECNLGYAGFSYSSFAFIETYVIRFVMRFSDAESSVYNRVSQIEMDKVNWLALTIISINNFMDIVFKKMPEIMTF